VQGAFAHGAVPRTNASSGETNVTEVAANPVGTGPPDGTVTVDVGVDVAGPAGAVEDGPPPAEAEAELAPPDAVSPLDAVAGELAEAPPPEPELTVPQAVSATAASTATDANPTRDARNDPFIRSPSTVARFPTAMKTLERRLGLEVFAVILGADGRSADSRPVSNAGALLTGGCGCLPASAGRGGLSG
jgi:hypothetical protein